MPCRLDARPHKKDSYLLNILDSIRRNYLFAPAVLAVTACTTQTVPLNSERIQQKFGNYGIDILESTSDIRRSNLFSIENGEKICRTYALVRFSEDVDESIAALHAMVLSGRSLGKTYKSDGWFVDKQTLHIGSFDLDATQPSALGSLMHLDDRTQLAHHVYRLVLKRGEQSINYAIISEAHHPDYLSQIDLREIYPPNKDDDLPDPSILELVRMMTDNAN